MSNSYLFQREPHWLNFTNLARQNISSDVQSWLSEPESLTQRLRNQWQNVSVQVLFEKQQTPFLTEWRILKLPQQRYSLVREVILLSNQMPLILARTVIPSQTLKIAQGNLARLGSRPLGEILFSAPSLARHPQGIALINPNQWQNALQNRLQINAPLWGRRTQYSIFNQPMLVSEFFLPSLFKQ